MYWNKFVFVSFRMKAFITLIESELLNRLPITQTIREIVVKTVARIENTVSVPVQDFSSHLNIEKN